jgi:hypothetical protein
MIRVKTTTSYELIKDCSLMIIYQNGLNSNKHVGKQLSVHDAFHQ